MDIERMKKILKSRGMGESEVDGVLREYESELGFIDSEVKSVLEMFNRVGSKPEGYLKCFGLVYVTDEYSGHVLHHKYRMDLACELRRVLGGAHRALSFDIRKNPEAYEVD